MHYNNIKINISEESFKRNGILFGIQFYYTPSTTLDPMNNLVYYFVSNGYGFSLPTCDYYSAPQTTYVTHNYNSCFTEAIEVIPVQEAKPTLISHKTEISETIEGSS
jgi:hypothetical protein